MHSDVNIILGIFLLLSSPSAHGWRWHCGSYLYSSANGDLFYDYIKEWKNGKENKTLYELVNEGYKFTNVAKLMT